MQKLWKLKDKYPPELGEKLPNMAPLALQLLYNRGLTDRNQAEEFLNPQYQNLHSPFLFKEMQKAVGRIWEAIKNNERITIYGDYDADAVTANAVLRQTFAYLGVEVESYIPDRFAEGYGVNLDALLKIKDKGSRIIITVDCGTNSVDAAEFCLQNNIDLIITDHHQIIGDLPKAYALINPKNPGDTYPYSEITGVGVAFKLASGILERVQGKGYGVENLHPQPSTLNPTKGWEKWLLDLVAIGTVADCHSLLGENRLLVFFGLKVLAKTKWVGLRALIASAGLNFTEKFPDTYALGFIIAPRLNAAGRLEHANVALNLLMEKDPVSAQQKAVALEQINSRRQDLTLRVISEAREQAELIRDRKILVLIKEDWNKGIVGLVAGKLAEEYNKPVIVLSKEGSEATGSARTAGDFDIIEALKFSSEFLVRFGGHKQAAGLTLKTENFESFYQKILEYAEKNLANTEKVLNLEAKLGENDLRLATCNLLNQFGPFGVDNPSPKFLLPSMVLESVRTVGKQMTHLQLWLRLGKTKIAAIAFNMGPFAKTLKVGDTVDIAGELTLESWNGSSKLKLRVVDIRNHSNILSS